MKILQIPNKIHLQICDPVHLQEDEAYLFDEFGDVTWAVDKIHSNDLEFLSKQGLKDRLEEMKTDAEVSGDYVKAVNDILNLIRVI